MFLPPGASHPEPEERRGQRNPLAVRFLRYQEVLPWSVTPEQFAHENFLAVTANARSVWTPSWEGRASVHVVFSTDCSAFQNWQSRVLFDSARRVGHVGPITRIASGCAEDQAIELAEVMRTDNFFSQGGKNGDSWFVHFTPHFSKDHKTGKDYKFYNKPRGILHWLKHGLGGAGSSGKREQQHGEIFSGGNAAVFANDIEERERPNLWPNVVALIDPDEIFLQPLSVWVRNSSNLLVTAPVKRDEESLPVAVERGRPAAQFYGLGDRWLRFKREYICGVGSPCLNVTSREAWRYYSIGPPYVAHVSDWIPLASSWVKFVPKVYEEYPQLLAEMYAYSLAAAHCRLPHARVDHYMVSNVGSYGEAWLHVDTMASVCAPGLPLSGKRGNVSIQLPTFLHACQSYQAGSASFSKRRVKHDIFKGCYGKLLNEPNEDIVSSGMQASVTKVALERAKKRRKLTKEEDAALKKKRNAFVVCTASKYVNAAIQTHRKFNCNRY